MAVLKCSICGGELDINAELSLGVCQHCGSTTTIPRDLDRKGNLYNRAVFLRQNNDFDRAVSAYEEILREDNSDAEAHWGLVLSKLGIEYVEDPRSGERMPTCHRTQAEPILADMDYLAALECADAPARDVYEREAKRINAIQSKIIEISKREAPYDLFICYKETDETGSRTEDSTLAQELYYELTKRGYRVFFARKTLESKLGEEYEPIIFAALSSARIMIVLGTRPEHFNAVWVRNEWSRFLKLAKTTGKVIIPAYKGMSPYELPSELANVQSQDMSKLGFMQDLTDGVDKIMKGGLRKPAFSADMPGVGVVSVPLQRLLQNGATYMKLGNYTAAQEVYTTVTKQFPESPRGWWGLIESKTRGFTDVLFDITALNEWFGYVRQLPDPGDMAQYESAYVPYLEKAAVLATDEDIEAINAIIVDISRKGRDVQDKLSLLETKKKTMQQTYGRASREVEGLISTYIDTINGFEKQDQRAGNAKVIGTALIFIGFLLFIGAVQMVLWALWILFAPIMIFIGFCLRSGKGKKRQLIRG